MEGLLAKIYDKIICNESDSIELGRRFDEEVTEIVKMTYNKFRKLISQK